MEQFLNSFGVLTDEEIASIQKSGEKRSFKKGGFFIREGQVCDTVGFVQSGCFRSYYHNALGDEVTYCFTFSNYFMTAYSSFIAQHKTVENIHAIADADVICIPRDVFMRLEQSSVNWLRLAKMIAEQEFIRMEQRIFSLLTETAEMKYKDLLKRNPEYLQMIPLNYLASYLGITQRHLSRIRKSISI
ncbi:Crp/Fnr family transcriptional regulator [Pseudochryseolinea flava]|uniref:Crp/Fnr family transcriptional regulator n=1 Tax=Pseudochryseolinea flava TaxID=2059302 RepID=A0A364Y800_9BACT|nr:Crp/Fnr family transcriptional regulator [Pseudochryseolinea flava]RAW02264.1 Crp/Fnr family transcriptional regulator [Pseudochryseolinea flava]